MGLVLGFAELSSPRSFSRNACDELDNHSCNKKVLSSSASVLEVAGPSGGYSPTTSPLLFEGRQLSRLPADIARSMTQPNSPSAPQNAASLSEHEVT